ncbi:MAG: ferrous iron transporter B, partial [Eggerthellales bacterium]|nr:ferrous iron transporter B [Eggerthellales bacterium]
MTIALVGNPNSGKTTLFNQLTGAHQYVGNWPGVTVEKKEGTLKGDHSVRIVDLPGIYSLSPYTQEEVVSRDFLAGGSVDAILNIVDATNLERNLFLTEQLMEFGIPVVVALNQMDIAEKRGYTIRSTQLGFKLGVPVVQVSALKGQGVQDCAAAAIKAAQQHQVPTPVTYTPEFETTMRQVEAQVPSTVPANLRRYYAIKAFERDEKTLQNLTEPMDVEDVVRQAEERFEDDAEGIVTDQRYGHITSFIGSVYEKGEQTVSTSQKIDRIMTNRFLALPLFILIIGLVYYIAVSTVGGVATDWANDGVFGDGWYLGPGQEQLDEATAAFEEGLVSEEPDPALFGMWIPGIPVIVEGWLDALQCADWLKALVLDGIIGGVGAVLGFVPQIMILFFLLAILEGCGYMSRVAFILDRVFRRFGLSGKTFIPMLIGTGCGVPAIMASRTIESDSARRLAVMTTTFVPCSAKLPIIALFAGAIFGGSGLVATLAYFAGIASVIVSGIILRKTKPFYGQTTPFVMELPEYRFPGFFDLLRSMWERAWAFIKKAGTIILLSCILIWFLSNFGWVDGAFTMLEEEQMGLSVLAVVASGVCAIFAPLGFGDWQATAATVTGLIAKENFVGTFAVLYGGEEGLWASLAATYTVPAALSL